MGKKIELPYHSAAAANNRWSLMRVVIDIEKTVGRDGWLNSREIRRLNKEAKAVLKVIKVESRVMHERDAAAKKEMQKSASR
jgi:hypothetical protein